MALSRPCCDLGSIRVGGRRRQQRRSGPAAPTTAALGDFGFSRDRSVHFIGIGGAGLSALAALAAARGWTVSGSDNGVDSLEVMNRIEALRKMGIDVRKGHSRLNIARRLPSFVVASTAVPLSNQEIQAAKALNVPVLFRRQWLRMFTTPYDVLAVAGTHGKTSTSALLAHTLQAIGLSPSAVIGGDVPFFGSSGPVKPGSNVVGDSGRSDEENAVAKNWIAGRGRELVIEADEYGGAFLALAPVVAVVTNVEWDHVDLYTSPDEYLRLFLHFADQIRDGGTLIACGDDPGARMVADHVINNTEGGDRRRVELYGLDCHTNDWAAIGLTPNSSGGTDYTLVRRNRPLGRVTIPLPGVHNVQNSLAAIAACAILSAGGTSLRLTHLASQAGAAESIIEDAGLAAQAEDTAMFQTAPVAAASLASFRGVLRRFQTLGTACGVTIIDDYAHHPTEIRASIQSARQKFDPSIPLWVIFQPHTFSRLKVMVDDMARSFSGADRVIVSGVYGAREDGSSKRTKKGDGRGSLDRDAPTVDIDGAYLAASIKDCASSYIDSVDSIVERMAFELSAKFSHEEVSTQKAQAEPISLSTTVDLIAETRGGSSSTSPSLSSSPPSSSSSSSSSSSRSSSPPLSGYSQFRGRTKLVLLICGAGDITVVGHRVFAMLEKEEERKKRGSV